MCQCVVLCYAERWICSNCRRAFDIRPYDRVRCRIKTVIHLHLLKIKAIKVTYKRWPIIHIEFSLFLFLCIEIVVSNSIVLIILIFHVIFNFVACFVSFFSSSIFFCFPLI